MNIETFEKIARQVSDLKKTGMAFDVMIEGDQHWIKGSTNALFSPTNFTITTFAQLSNVVDILDRAIYIPGTSVKIPDFKHEQNIKSLNETIRTEKAALDLRKEFSTVKYCYPNLYNQCGFDFKIISATPQEHAEEGITYRYIGTPNANCLFCLPHTDPRYVYLDKGFVFITFNALRQNNKLQQKFVITNELNPDTMLVMIGCCILPSFLKNLDNDCFVPAAKAKILRIKLEKELAVTPVPIAHGGLPYNDLKKNILAGYEKTINSNLLVKVQRGELPHAKFNEIRITPTSASYGDITIEAPGLLADLNNILIFDDNTDIYTITGAYMKNMVTLIEGTALPAPVVEKEGDVETVKPGVLTQSIKVNGFNVVISRTTANSRRYVNGYAINLDEVLAVCSRATCFRTQEQYDTFVSSVNAMSLKWHDAIGMGLPVKIHDGITNLEYSRAEAPVSSPRIRFIKETDGVYLITGDGKDDKAKIKLNDAIKAIQSLNKKTNNNYIAAEGYTPKNAVWARRKLGVILKECCTFDRRVVNKDADGNDVITKEKYCTLSDDKAKFISKMASEYYEKAVQRSKQLLSQAITLTGAVEINFAGSPCYYVEGKLHKYALDKATNVVYNYDTGKAICIVEPGHRVDIGYDATVARLLALKNDSVTAEHVQTLHRG